MSKSAPAVADLSSPPSGTPPDVRCRPRSHPSSRSSRQDGANSSDAESSKSSKKRYSEKVMGRFTEKVCTFQKDGTGYGFSVQGTAPSVVGKVRPGGLADRAGLKVGDQILKVNGMFVADKSHNDIVQMITGSDSVELLLLVPRPESSNYGAPPDNPSSGTDSAPFSPEAESCKAELVKATRQAIQRVKHREQGNPGGTPPLRSSYFEAINSGEVPVVAATIETREQKNSENAFPLPKPRGFAASQQKGRAERPMISSAQHNRSLSEAASLLDAGSGLPQPQSSAFYVNSGSLDRHGRKTVQSVALQPSADHSGPPSVVHRTVPPPRPPPLTCVPAGRIHGRRFSDDSDEEELEIGTDIDSVASLFTSTARVVRNPALTAVLINYLFTNNRDVAPLLFYLVAQDYKWALSSSKELFREGRRVAMEIYTTFLHEKSPLHVRVGESALRQTLQDLTGGDPPPKALFSDAAEAALALVKEHIDKFAKELRHGLATWKRNGAAPISRNMTRDEEMTTFDQYLIDWATHFNQRVVGGSGLISAVGSAAANPLQAPSEAQALATLTGLATIYRYYAASGGNGDPEGQEVDSCSISSTGGPPVTGQQQTMLTRKQLLARSIDNLTAIGPFSPTSNAAIWLKFSAFNAKISKKNTTAIFKWNSKYKGHSLQDRNFETPTSCFLCGDLLWGLAPQGLQCSNCDRSMHVKCKTHFKETCVKEKGANRKKLSKSGSPDGLGPTGSVPTTNPTTLPVVPKRPRTTGKPPPHPDYLVTVVCQGWLANGTTPKHSTPIVPPNSTPASSTGDTRSSEWFSFPNVTVGEAATGGEETESGDPRHVKRLQLQFERAPSVPISVTESQTPVVGPELLDPGTAPPRSDSSHSLGGHGPVLSLYASSSDTSTLPTGNSSLAGHNRELSVSSSVDVQDLVHSSLQVDWSDDIEMAVRETFEADLEIQQQFPAYVIPGKKDDQYVRLLVLLEFHHKTRYMIRYLKLFHYFLICKWPKDQELLSRILALDCIPELISLFRDLVSRIEGTKTPNDYQRIANEVEDWLTGNNDANFKKWQSLCQTLCCTNILDCVKATIREAKRHPELQPLLEARYNKIVVVDALSQLRVFLFSLPMIVNKIIHDLDKRTKFKSEAKTWKKIHGKISGITQFVDSVCKPLIDLINSGQVVSGIDRKEWNMRMTGQKNEFSDLLEFPKTLFHYQVRDFKEVVVYKLTLTNKDKVNLDYVKENTDMLAILLDSALLLLVKENDKFVFKAFKSVKDGQVNRISPIFPLEKNIYASPGENVGGNYLLNIVFMSETILVRILFHKEADRKSWSGILSDPKYIATLPVRSMSLASTTLPANVPGRTPIGGANSSIRQFASMREPSLDLAPDDILLPAKTVPPIAENEGHPLLQNRQLAMDEGVAETVKEPEPSDMDDMDGEKIRLDKALDAGVRAHQDIRESLCNVLHVDKSDLNNMVDLMETQGPRDIGELLLVYMSLLSRGVSVMPDLVRSLPLSSSSMESSGDVAAHGKLLDEMVRLGEAMVDSVEKYKLRCVSHVPEDDDDVITVAATSPPPDCSPTQLVPTPVELRDVSSVDQFARNYVSDLISDAQSTLSDDQTPDGIAALATSLVERNDSQKSNGTTSSSGYSAGSED